MKFNKKSLLTLLVVPLLANLIFNLFTEQFYFSFQNSSAQQEIVSVFLALFIFIFYYFLGELLQPIFKTKYVSSSISIFWLSIFAFENIFILIFRNYRSQYIFITALVSYLLIAFFQYKKIKNLSKVIFSFLSMRIIFQIVNSNVNNLELFFNQLYTSDESRLWYPAISGIYNESYYQILTNNPYPGYGLLTSYIGAMNTFFLTGLSEFNYYLAINYLFIFLFVFLLYEICKRLETFVFLSSLFGIIILTSHWFTYVFFGSLLSEGISSFLFGVLFTELIRNKQIISYKKLNLLLIVSFGFLYYSRQFITSLVVLFVLYNFMTKRSKIYLFGLFPPILKIFQSNIFENTFIDPYINEDQLSTIYFNFGNVIKLIQQFILDKPVSYLVLVFILFVFLTRSEQENYFDFYLFIFLNTILVLALMIFLWDKSDVQSSYRYIMNVFYLLIYPLSSMVSQYLKG